MTPGHLRWNDVFRRSSIALPLFAVATDWRNEVFAWVEAHDPYRMDGGWVGGASPGGHVDVGVTSTTHAFVGGYLYETQRVGWDWGGNYLPSGMWLIGFGVMRTACAFLGAKPPARRLKGEELETAAALRAGFRVQGDDYESVGEKARVLTNAEYPRDLQDFIVVAYGVEELWLREPDRAPGAGAWGESGFTRSDQEFYETQGLDAEGALFWMGLGVCPADRLPAPGSLSALEQRLGRGGIEAWVRGQEEGASLLGEFADRFEQLDGFIREGLSPFSTRRFMRGGLSVTDYREFGRLGIGDREGFAQMGMRPLEAREWIEAGLDAWTAREVLAIGATLEEAARLRQEGLSNHLVVRRLRGGY